MTTAQIQHLLAYLGYYTLTVDGISGPGTRAAVIAFQKDFGGLTADGIPGDATQKALLHAVAYGVEQPETAKPPDFWDGIQYFNREEFRCQCGGKYCKGFPSEPEEALVKAADQVRSHFSSPVTVSSGVRCTRHNEAVGGVSNSRHLTGKAVDFAVKGRNAGEVLSYVGTLPQIRYAYAIDGGFVHMDVV